MDYVTILLCIILYEMLIFFYKYIFKIKWHYSVDFSFLYHSTTFGGGLALVLCDFRSDTVNTHMLININMKL